ncbi:hypothetical protein [Pseudomonas sp. R37(2017)]|uniref:hypothetical protein n=1 Tax=Pseudomonas sp. R37(2017) TaxID=1981685 RepID=UPI000A1F172A|nr:hypothetical protein [Pseudomonas sp. R37(2017)]
MLSEIICFLKSVPDVIWSGVAASGITLLGVMVSNRSNTSRLVLQLNHDATEKSKERVSNLRREVYLKAFEDIEVASLHISNLSSRSLTNLNLMSELQEITGSIARLKLVAESKTSILAGGLGVELGSLFLKLLPRLAVIQAARTDIEINNSLHESSSAEASRVIREMNKLNEEGRQNEVAFQSLQSSYEFNSSQAQQYADARALAYEALHVGLREFSTMLFPEMKALSKIQLKVMVAIREDLGIACDVADFQRQLERQWAVMEAGYGDAMKDLKGE